VRPVLCGTKRSDDGAAQGRRNRECRTVTTEHAGDVLIRQGIVDCNDARRPDVVHFGVFAGFYRFGAGADIGDPSNQSAGKGR
jgi:hypothetical protein